MLRYAQVINGVVETVIESATDPDGISGSWIACGDAGPGWTYDGTTFQPKAEAIIVNPAEWLIDVGPFFDRFGAAKMALLTSTNATVQALIKDLQIRKWIDLQRPDVAAGIDAIIALGVAGVDATLKTAILTAPVTPDENLALRKSYFS